GRRRPGAAAAGTVDAGDALRLHDPGPDVHPERVEVRRERESGGAEKREIKTPPHTHPHPTASAAPPPPTRTHTPMHHTSRPPPASPPPPPRSPPLSLSPSLSLPLSPPPPLPHPCLSSRPDIFSACSWSSCGSGR